MILGSASLVILLYYTASLANSLKLTLKQDLSQLQEQLSPGEIGQFLHSIKDLPQLAEYLDPSRSPVHFDLFYYYNEFGCREARIFDMNRIRFIMTYGNLKREDKLVLLNGWCIINWPGLWTIPYSDLAFILATFPESNPLLQLKNQDTISDAMDLFDWKGYKEKYPERLSLFLDNAAKNREQFHYIPSIEKLFKWKIVNYQYFDIANRVNLIGPSAIDACIGANTRSRKNRRDCSKMILNLTSNRNDVSERDLFYWSLNIVTVFKYDRGNVKLSDLKSQFSKLYKSCKWYQVEMITFLKKLETVFTEFFENYAFDHEAITGIFQDLCQVPKWEDTADEGEQDLVGFDNAMYTDRGDNVDDSTNVGYSNSQSDLAGRGFDKMMMAIEFYLWLVRSNSEYFEIQEEYERKWLNMIQTSLSYQRTDPRYREHFMVFLASPMIPGWTSSLEVFQRFIENNYTKPSNDLLIVFRNLSWFNFKDKLNFLKGFLPLDIRLNQLKKLSFSNRNDLSNPSTIDIYFDENASFANALFDGFFNSILDNDLLVYPLRVDASSSQFLSNVLNNDYELAPLLKKFWHLLGSYNNGFAKYHPGSEYIDGYPVEFLPTPWAHPNVLQVMGCVMTLAILHGIKLTGWSLNREFFDSIFKEFYLSPAYNVEEEGGEKRLVFFEEGPFLDLYSMKVFSISIKELLENQNHEPSALLLSVYNDLSNFTKKCLKNYQMKLFDPTKESEFSFTEQHFEEIKISKLFRVIEDKTCSDDKESGAGAGSMDLDDKKSLQLDLLKSFEFEELDTSSINHYVKLLKDPENDEQTPTVVVDYTAKMIKLQSIGLYLGLQPIIRHLTAEEAYKLLFHDNTK